MPEDDEAMSDLKAKLALDVFKEDKEFPIVVRKGKERDPRLRKMVRICPAGLYREDASGAVTVSEDGCLECGTCLRVCGGDVLDWRYPNGGAGVQFRFG